MTADDAVFGNTELEEDQRKEQESELAHRQIKVLGAVRSLFANNEEGRLVLEHLGEIARENSTSYVEGDPHTTIFNEGKRGLLLYLKRLIEDSKNEKYLEVLLKATEIE